MKKYLLYCLAFSLMACSSLNKTNTKAKTGQRSLLDHSYEQLITTTVLKVRSDSTALEEEVLLWPKGIVKYSPTTGFEGELTKIALRKKVKQQALQQELQNTALTLKDNLKVQQEEKALVKVDTKKRLAAWRLAGLGCLLLAVVVVYLWYKRKQLLLK